MKTPPLLLLSLVSILIFSGQAMGAIVYMTDPATQFGNTQLNGNATAEMGDQVTLAGSARLLLTAETTFSYFGGTWATSPFYLSNVEIALYYDADLDNVPDSNTPFATSDLYGPLIDTSF